MPAAGPTTMLLIRHGRAESGSGMPDDGRHLTGEGELELRASCAGLRALGVRPDLIMTSPLTRAVETATIVSAELGIGKEPRPETALEPGATLEGVVQLVAAIEPGTVVAIVGHAPDLSQVVAGLASPGGPRTVSFAPGSFACLEFDGAVVPGAGRLAWARRPEELAALSTSRNHPSG